MARDAQYWARWRSYQETGKWPETENQRKTREAKEREAAEPVSTEQAHPAASPQLANAPKIEEEPKEEDHVSKVVRLWWEAHPELKPNKDEQS